MAPARRSARLAPLLAAALAALASPPAAAPLRAQQAPTRLPVATNLLTGHPALAPDGRVHGVVEIPAGTNAKWQASADGSALEWELEGGRPRVVRYLPYPANYGMIPRTRGGDGDPLDVLLLAEALPRGAVVPAHVVGVLRLVDTGEVDDKVLAVPAGSPLEGVADLDDLEKRFPGVLQVLETWFRHYKGPGRTESRGWAGRDAALRTVREAAQAFETRAAEAADGG